MKPFAACMHRFAGNQRGAAAIEYSLIAALIAVVIIAAVTLLGGEVGALFNYIANTASSAIGG